MRTEREPHNRESTRSLDARHFRFVWTLSPSAVSQPSCEQSERPTHPRLIRVFVCFAYVSGCVVITQLCGGGAHLDAASSPVFAVSLTEGPSFFGGRAATREPTWAHPSESPVQVYSHSEQRERRMAPRKPPPFRNVSGKAAPAEARANLCANPFRQTHCFHHYTNCT